MFTYVLLFLPRDAMLARYAVVVCLFVYRKRLNVGSCKQSHTIAQGLRCSCAKDLGKTETESPQGRRQMQVG